MPHSHVNVPGDYFSLAGFEVFMDGRFWVFTEGFDPAGGITALEKLHKGHMYRNRDLGFVDQIRATHDAPGDRTRKLEAGI